MSSGGRNNEDFRKELLYAAATTPLIGIIGWIVTRDWVETLIGTALWPIIGAVVAVQRARRNEREGT